MNYSKRILALIVLTVMLLSTVACTIDNTATPEKTTSVATGETEVGEAPSGETTPSGTAATPSGDVTDIPEIIPTPEPTTDPVSVIAGDIRIQLLSDTIVRVEEKKDGVFEDRATLNVLKRKWNSVEYEKTEKDGETVITAKNYIITVPASNKFEDVTIQSTDGELLWRYEKLPNERQTLPSPSDDIRAWSFRDTPRSVISDNGYSIGKDSIQKLNGWDIKEDVNDSYVFLPCGSYRTFLKDFVTLTGSSEMINLKMLGFWDSRWYQYTEETAIKQINDYLDRGYPIDMLVIDTDWRDKSATSGVGYNINTSLFPNIEGFFDKAHELGVEIVFNDHPEPVEGTSNLLDKAEIKFREENLQKILSMGLDYWWYDRNWTVSLKSISPSLSLYSTGMYAFYTITQDHYEKLAAENGEEYARRALMMANVDGIWNGRVSHASEIFTHRYTIQWTGDIGSAAEDLYDEIYNAVYGGTMMGLPYISADIGGHTTKVTNDMYVRWVQFGALSPIFRVHCTKNLERMPWKFGTTAEKVFHEYVDMRYRLLPLYYSLAHENHVSGLPLVRRLDINYPQYAEASANDQYLLGDYILIAPIHDTFDSIEGGFTLTDDNGNQGLLGEYFDNNNTQGTPVFTRNDTDLNFDWGQGSPDSRLPANDFSIRWKGNITIGENDINLTFFADDGIVITIDGKTVVNGWNTYDQKFTSGELKAGTTHRIVIRYCEKTSNAHFYMNAEIRDGYTRDVFIPDGEWVDVWTGKTYVGPTTITVKHSLETSPIFVRRSSVITLADNMSNTDEKDWSHLTLDVHPGDIDAFATLYEDDTKTVAYKDGKYRLTSLEGSLNKNTYTLKINGAVGKFDGDKFFTERDWTVRAHKGDFGTLQKVLLNGKEISFETYLKSEDSTPFAIVGAALDSDIYEVSFKSNVYTESTLEFVFESVSATEKNTEYDNSSADFTVNVEEIKKTGTTVDITSVGAKDWLLMNVGGVNVYKNVKEHLIGAFSAYGDKQYHDSFPITWSDGAETESGRTTSGFYSEHAITGAVKVPAGESEVILYLGGWKSQGKLTVKDRAGNVKTVEFGNPATNHYYKVTLPVSSKTGTVLTFEFYETSGENITIAAVAVK